jgi:cysteine-rich repeat protein
MSHTRASRRVRQAATVLATLVVLLAMARTDAVAGRLFTVVSGMGMVCEIDPVTGVEIFSFNTPGMGVHPGLAFNGTELFYTDETLGVVKVYLPDGTFVRDIAKPGIGPTAGAGLGTSGTSLFGVGVDDETITAVDPADGSFQSSFGLSQAKSALTFAGARGSIFVRVGDSATIDEVLPNGTVLNTIPSPVNVSGLAYSSSLNRLFAVVIGTLYAMDPDTGALLPGYPVRITGADGYRVPKSGAAAADESVPEPFCGDQQTNAPGETCDPPGASLPNGHSCRDDCTFCGDGNADASEECDDGNNLDGDGCSASCVKEFCGDGRVNARGEDCDDGNNLDGDGCSSTCVREFCGDGIVQAELGERCEPPSTPGCDRDCHRTEICDNLVDDNDDGRTDCEDPLCPTCLPILRDPGRIRFDPTGAGHDDLTVHGSFEPATAIDPLSQHVGILLTNARGTVYRAELPPGTMRGTGRVVSYRDKAAARAHHGIASLTIRLRRPGRGTYTFTLKAYDDLSAATEARMTLQWYVGDGAFMNESEWHRTGRGWTLHLPGE